jgi:hypothetical protein|tara:strand:- start:2029 stop:2538 length:510 start_codon:yes stop_codon:yes gene_type:complete
MTEEYNFKSICNLTTKLLGLPDDALALKSRKRPLQVARAIAGYIGRTEEDINQKIIGKVLNRDRTLIYHYENTHKTNYANCSIYRDTFNKVYKAYKDIDGIKEVFIDGDFMKSYLLKNEVVETLNPEVILEVKSGQVKCKIKTSYFDFSNQLEIIKLALKNYHYTIKII